MTKKYRIFLGIFTRKITKIYGTFFGIFTREKRLKYMARSLVFSCGKDDWKIWHVLWCFHAGKMTERYGMFFGIFTRKKTTERYGTFFDIFTQKKRLHYMARSLVSSRGNDGWTIWHVFWCLHAWIMAERYGTFFSVFTRKNDWKIWHALW